MTLQKLACKAWQSKHGFPGSRSYPFCILCCPRPAVMAGGRFKTPRGPLHSCAPVQELCSNTLWRHFF